MGRINHREEYCKERKERENNFLKKEEKEKKNKKIRNGFELRSMIFKQSVPNFGRSKPG
jgi:hypothetical protein